MNCISDKDKLSKLEKSEKILEDVDEYLAWDREQTLGESLYHMIQIFQDIDDKNQE